jgi:hypothetical protein
MARERAPALMIGVGEVEPGGEAEPAPDASAGVLATTAFCKAKDRGDYEAAYEAFKEMLQTAAGELDGEEPEDESMPMPMPA